MESLRIQKATLIDDIEDCRKGKDRAYRKAVREWKNGNPDQSRRYMADCARASLKLTRLTQMESQVSMVLDNTQFASQSRELTEAMLKSSWFIQGELAQMDVLNTQAGMVPSTDELVASIDRVQRVKSSYDSRSEFDDVVDQMMERMAKDIQASSALDEMTSNLDLRDDVTADRKNRDE